jgi:hypothetical protein
VWQVDGVVFVATRVPVVGGAGDSVGLSGTFSTNRRSAAAAAAFLAGGRRFVTAPAPPPNRWPWQPPVVVAPSFRPGP